MSAPPLLVLVGPTAVGKTAVAVRLAAQVAMEVISADSRQVYRGMDIGTGKPSASPIPHHQSPSPVGASPRAQHRRSGSELQSDAHGHVVWLDRRVKPDPDFFAEARALLGEAALA